MSTEQFAGLLPGSEPFDPRAFFKLARRVGHGRALGMEFHDAGDTWAELSLPWKEELVGMPERGLLASGAIVSLIDTASGTSVWVALGKFMPIATINMRIDYLRPARSGETIYARCGCTKLTHQVAFTRGIAHTGDPDRPIAHSSGTFMLGT
jgi:uncharacterized protein (TIGR00369 family)